MTTALKVRPGTRMEVWIPCRGCNGKGKTSISTTKIDPKSLALHNASHTNKKVEGTNGQYQDQTCDCPRVPARLTSPCLRCGGDGQELARLTIPSPGDKVKVLDAKLLTQIFGSGDEPNEPGRVYDAQSPDEHHLELRTGVGVRVTWDRLTKDGKIPKGKEVELWTFDLSELAVVR